MNEDISIGIFYKNYSNVLKNTTMFENHRTSQSLIDLNANPSVLSQSKSLSRSRSECAIENNYDP